jgi:hypothetical protein
MTYIHFLFYSCSCNKIVGWYDHVKSRLTNAPMLHILYVYNDSVVKIITIIVFYALSYIYCTCYHHHVIVTPSYTMVVEISFLKFQFMHCSSILSCIIYDICMSYVIIIIVSCIYHVRSCVVCILYIYPPIYLSSILYRIYLSRMPAYTYNL